VVRYATVLNFWDENQWRARTITVHAQSRAKEAR
jgi:hypothetical protein